MLNLNLEINSDRIRREFYAMRNAAKQMTSGIVTDAERMDAAMLKFRNTLIQTAAQIGGGIGLVQLARQIATTRGEFQQLEVAFTTLLQSKEKADKLMAEMVELAAKTPFDLQGVASGARQLLAYGFAADEITDTLTRLGNVAAGLGLPLERLTYLYGTTAVQGRLFARDMLQFTGSGIPVLQGLADMYGKTTEEINAMVSAGKIGFEDVRKVFEQMTNQGGKFYNLMQEQSKTINGQISNLQDAIDMMFNEIGKSQEGVINSAISGAAYLVENYRIILDILTTLVATYGTYKAALIAVAAWQKASVTASSIKAFYELAKNITSAKDAMILFNIATKANPLGLFLSLITGVVTALSLFSKRSKEANSIIGEQEQAIINEGRQVNTLVAKLTNANTKEKERKEALSQLKSIQPSIVEGISKESDATKVLTQNLIAYNEEQVKRLVLSRKNDALTAAGEKYNEAQASIAERELEAISQIEKIQQRINRGDFSIRDTRNKKILPSENTIREYAKQVSEIISSELSTPEKAKTLINLYDPRLGRIDLGKDKANLHDIVSEIDELSNKAYEAKVKLDAAQQEVADSARRLGLEMSTSISSTVKNAGSSINANLEVEINNARENVKTLKQELNNLLSGIAPESASEGFTFGAAISEKREELKNAENALNSLLGIDPKTMKKASDKAVKEYEARIKAEKSFTERIAKLKIQAENIVRQAEIDAMEDGSDKVMAQLELEHNIRLQAIKEQTREVGEEMQKLFNGNVDLRSRPIIDASKLAEKNWKDVGNGIATVFSSQYGIKDAKGSVREILVTPILPDGTVLSQNELEDYIFNILEGADNILKADKKGIVISIDVDQDGNAGEKLHQMQELYYDILQSATSAENTRYTTEQANIQKEQLNKLLDDYATYAQRRQKIEEDAQKAISRLQEKNTSGQYDANIAEVKRKALKELQLISEAEASDMQKTSSILVDLFGEASEKSVSEINRITTAIQEMLSYIATTNMEDITDKFGFTSSQLKSLKSAPKDLEAIKNAVEDLRRASVQKNPFAALVKDLKALFATSKNARDTAKKIADIGESASASADRIGTLTGQLSEMFEAMGNSSMSEAMNGAQDVMSSISNIGQGFAKGGIIGGIGAAVGEAAGWISKAFQANARHKAALKEIMNEVISQQREYNLLLMEQNLEYEKGITIFGSDTYGKAVNAISVMRDAYKQLQTAIKGTTDQQKKFARRESSNFVIDLVFGKYNAAKEAYAGLADIEVKTGHKKTGLFGWGKGKDIYSSILDVYPDLIDANGKFNASLAETIINSRKMSDEDKAALQNMIDLTNQAKDALDQVNDYLTGIFGDLGSTMTDALVDAFANGTDAAMAFADSVSEMLEKMSKEMIYSVTLAPIFKKAQEDILAAMEGADLTDEQRFNKYVEILDKATQNALAQQGNFDALLEKYQEIAKKHGYNIFTPEQTEQQATSKGFQTMSQDTGDELNGRFTVMTDIMAKSKDIQQNIMGATFDIRDLAMAANNHLQMISRNTAVLSDMNARLKVIEENTGYLK